MDCVNLLQIKLLPHEARLETPITIQHVKHSDFFNAVRALSSSAVSCAQVMVMHVFLLYIAAQRAIYHKTTGSWLGEWGYISYRHSVGQNYCSGGTGPLKKGRIGIILYLCVCVCVKEIVSE